MWSNFIIIGLLFTTNVFSITYKEWVALSREDKVEYLDSNFPQASYAQNKWSYRTTLAPLLTAIKHDQKSLIKRFSDYKTEASLEVEDDFYALVGEIEVSSDLYYSDDYKLLAVTFHYLQRGCSHEDEESGDFIEQSGHYKDYTEAHKNNCFDTDVSWSAFSYADANFIELSHSDYMEWSGH